MGEERGGRDRGSKDGRRGVRAAAAAAAAAARRAWVDEHHLASVHYPRRRPAASSSLLCSALRANVTTNIEKRNQFKNIASKTQFTPKFKQLKIRIQSQKLISKFKIQIQIIQIQITSNPGRRVPERPQNVFEARRQAAQGHPAGGRPRHRQDAAGKGARGCAVEEGGGGGGARARARLCRWPGWLARLRRAAAGIAACVRVTIPAISQTTDDRSPETATATPQRHHKHMHAHTNTTTYTNNTPKKQTGEAMVPFYQMAGTEFTEGIVGLGAARVRDLFKRARTAAPCVIFVAELAALGVARASGGARVGGRAFEGGGWRRGVRCSNQGGTRRSECKQPPTGAPHHAAPTQQHIQNKSMHQPRTIHPQPPTQTPTPTQHKRKQRAPPTRSASRRSTSC